MTILRRLLRLGEEKKEEIPTETPPTSFSIEDLMTPTDAFSLVKKSIHKALEANSKAREAAKRVIAKSDTIIPKDE